MSQVDILVNNNGGPPYRPFSELDREAILKGVVNNMVAPLELIQAVMGGMADRGFGRIVNITSLSVYKPISGLDLSSGARAGLTSFLAASPHGRRHATSPSTTSCPASSTPIGCAGRMSRARSRTPPRPRRARPRRPGVPAKRLGTPEEFGQVGAFLCSVQAGYLTGQNIPVEADSTSAPSEA